MEELIVEAFETEDKEVLMDEINESTMDKTSYDLFILMSVIKKWQRT